MKKINKTARRMFAAILIAVAIFWQPSGSQATEKVFVASAIDQSRVAAVSKIILVRAYAALGYKLNVAYFPALRALLKANRGQTDAELARTELAGSTYPNLVQVPESLFDLRSMAFVTDKTLMVRS